jgi:hypothetical protein
VPNREIDGALKILGVHAGGNALYALLEDLSGEQGRRGPGAVARLIRALRGDFAHYLSAHILEFVFEFDFLGDGEAALGDAPVPTKNRLRLVNFGYDFLFCCRFFSRAPGPPSFSSVNCLEEDMNGVIANRINTTPPSHLSARNHCL